MTATVLVVLAVAVLADKPHTMHKLVATAKHVDSGRVHKYYVDSATMRGRKEVAGYEVVLLTDKKLYQFDIHDGNYCTYTKFEADPATKNIFGTLLRELRVPAYAYTNSRDRPCGQRGRVPEGWQHGLEGVQGVRQVRV